jgi:hypothetical protein
MCSHHTHFRATTVIGETDTGWAAPRKSQLLHCVASDDSSFVAGVELSVDGGMAQV